MADMDMLAAMGITGFGKATKKRQLDPARFDKSKRAAELPTPEPSTSDGPPSFSENDSRPFAIENQPPGPSSAPASIEPEEPEYDPSDQEDQPEFPITHELLLKDHTKVVSALALDPSGARIVSGSHDYDCKLWDFGGMDSQCKPFKSWEPAGTNYVNDLKYSNDGQKILVISGTNQARLFDRDGEEVYVVLNRVLELDINLTTSAAFIKGDPYIRDMKNTSGHVGELTSCAWHPHEAKTFITSSTDSTIRIWDVENKRKQKTVIVVKSKERGARTKVTSCAYSIDGRMIGGACLDGAFHLWQTNSNFVRPQMTMEGAHTKGTETGSVTFSVDGRTVLTRGGDDTAKLWDLRNHKQPVAIRSDLATLYPSTNAMFSPDDKYVITGAGATAKGGSGRLTILKKDTLELVRSLEVDATPVKVFWHSKINQIVAGLSNGQIVVLYSPTTSINGAKLLANKGPPRKVTIEDMSDALAAPAIITPHALPMFRDMDPGRGTKRKAEKDRQDPRKSRRPELPVTGPGKGGRVGASATQHVVQNLVRDTTRDEDPREALLKYAEKAENDPQWTAAWKTNQPKPSHFSQKSPQQIFCSPLSRRDSHASIMNDGHDQSHVSNGVLHDQQTPELVVNHAQLNGNSIKRALSPATPISTVDAPDVKIDIDYPEQESDARHEPLPIKPLDSIEKTVDVVSSVQPIDSSTTVPIHHQPNGTQSPPPPPPPPQNESLEDVKMNEDLTIPPTINGTNHSARNDVDMNDNTETPATTPGLHADSSSADVATTSYPPHEDDQPPPAKRARMESEPNEAVPNSATPPPESAQPSSANTPVPTPAVPSTITAVQFRFFQSVIRSLKKSKDAVPFLRPVDYVALNIPHYPSIIKTPMDFSTIERKLVASNPTKPDPNPNNPRYHTTDEFISDVRLIFQNCITFNGPDHVVSAMGKRTEEVFDKQIKHLPAAEPKPVIPKKVATPPPPPPPVTAPPKKTAAPARRPSTSVPVIRRSENEAIGRPKREIHPPPPKDLAYADAPKRPRKTKTGKDDGTAEQLRFCGRLLNELHKKQYATIASPFYLPVDWKLLEIPTYPKIIKKPMDLSTMRQKLESNAYPTAQKFFDDFKLMIRNCFMFNPAGTPVNQAGIELQRLFDEKWKSLPPLHEHSDEEEEEEEEDSDMERQRTIAIMESQIETMKGNIAALRNQKENKAVKKKKEKRDKLPPVPSSSKASSKPSKTTSSSSKKKVKKPITENDVLSFEQKKDLSESIAKLDEQKLEKVINIIHEGVPEIRDSTEEIELEIDTLPPAVLTKLYNFVIRPLRAPPTKRNRTGKGTGTGGLKRKSMDEDVEAEKIRLLEERMLLFDSKANGTPLPPTQEASDSDSSDSDSSGSDSE
ncbi:hypothetical protein H0H93_014423 [Arthromyces matolae]|nr:hypothetical protein H0H93_014423 [Arthromyces matolae]